MAAAKVTPDKTVPCPLLGKDIPEAMCYEINKVIDGDVTENFVPEVVEWDTAKRLCPGCDVSYCKDIREYKEKTKHSKKGKKAA